MNTKEILDYIEKCIDEKIYTLNYLIEIVMEYQSFILRKWNEE